MLTDQKTAALCVHMDAVYTASMALYDFVSSLGDNVETIEKVLNERLAEERRRTEDESVPEEEKRRAFRTAQMILGAMQLLVMWRDLKAGGLSVAGT